MEEKVQSKRSTNIEVLATEINHTNQNFERLEKKLDDFTTRYWKEHDSKGDRLSILEQRVSRMVGISIGGAAVVSIIISLIQFFSGGN